MAGLIRREQVPMKAAYAPPDLERRALDLVAKAEKQAQAVLAKACERAAEIEREARQASEKIYQEARAEGLVAGREEGRQELLREVAQARADAIQQAQAEIRQTAAALESAGAQFDRERHGLLALAEAGMLELAVAIARRVCRITAAGSSEVALANARSLLEMVRHCTDVELRICPQDYEHVATLAPERAAPDNAAAHVRFVADPQVEPGGCLLRTADGVIEANLSAQLDRIAQALCGELARVKMDEAIAPVPSPPPPAEIPS